MSHTVFFTRDAVRDLDAIRDYLLDHGGVDGAIEEIDRLQKRIKRLHVHPERGHVPRELHASGLQDIREIIEKPYRILYRVTGTQVFVLLVAHERRDMQTLLQRRLLRG
ncbi:type II toxin-antitoxin system RelE/ParE family toxin [bacterium]|nr:type II toxin-antitoxin system RelE/ParE family toxin [bacterium]